MNCGSVGSAARTDYVLEPTLVEMYRMRESPAGIDAGLRRTVAVTSIRLRLLGPVDRIGKRPVLLEETFQEIAGTKPSLDRPEYGFALAQMELTFLIARFAQRLDVTPPSGGKPQPVGMVVNRPRGGVPFSVARRS